jgi:hypothetical protein
MPNSILGFVPNLSQKSAKEWAGPCPWCGGKDRFIVWPYQGNQGRFLCRKCGQKGDAIDILRARGLTFQEALLEVDGKNTFNHSINIPKIKRLRPGFQVWQKSARELISNLSSQESDDLTKILEKRYLHRRTSKTYEICWNPTDLYYPPETWGLEGPKVRIPAGLVIPIHREGQIYGLKVRCRNPKVKYWQVRGSGDKALIIGTAPLPTLIVESELDAYLIHQEAGDIVNVIAMGGLKKSFDPESLKIIEKAPKVFFASDFDECKEPGELGAGQAAFADFQHLFPNLEYLPPAVGKDPTEMHAMGVPIRSWILAALNESDQIATTQKALPMGFLGSYDSLVKNILAYPHLVPCPKTKSPWSWRYRIDCNTCNGHLQCIKDWH